MHIICLTPVEDGVYNDHSAEHITTPPEGWAVILHEGDPTPKEWKGKEIDYSLPSTFPRLGSIEAEELTYTREVEVQKEVTKTRPVEIVGESGEETVITEEYTEMETVMETQEYKMMTVTHMTEGMLPEVVPEDHTPTTKERVAALEEENSMLKAQISAQSDQMDFYEDCIAEMAMVVYA